MKKNIEFDLTMTFDPDWMVNPEESAECAAEGQPPPEKRTWLDRDESYRGVVGG